jgi:CRISPR-associated protein Csb2
MDATFSAVPVSGASQELVGQRAVSKGAEQSSKIVVWKIESALPLPLSKTAWVAEGLRRSLMSRVASNSGPDHLPAGLSGHNDGNERNFPHSSFVPLDLDLDGFLDHVAFLFPVGIEDAVRFAALGLQFIRLYGEGIMVVPIYFGSLKDSPVIGIEKSVKWVSVSPWAHPWHLKKRFGFADQLTEELRRDGYPVPSEIAFSEQCFLRGAKCDVRCFPYRRPGKDLVRHSVQMKFVKLTFAEAVEGPLLLGRARNFGYGLFVPA